MFFFKKTCFSEHNDDGVSIKPLHLSMAVFLCDENNTIVF